jgi:oligoendopeptidase F
MHSVLSAKAQPYATADYATFIAEIASTCNEALLMQAMLRNAKDDDERLFFLGSQLEGLRTTYFRQAQFAEFEMAIHDQVEHGTPLTGESLSATYLDILKRYYGDKEGVTHISERDAMEWAYIPHFYYNFYVYQYATSIAASSQFSADILAKKPGVLDKYITLLSSGGSDDPYKLLTTAGVDLATPAPYDAVAAQMNRVMDQMEALIAKKAGAKPGKKGK